MLKLTKVKNVNVTLVVSDFCHECDELETELKRIICKTDRLNFIKIHKNDFNNLVSSNGFKIHITPALIINGRLIQYGNPGNRRLKKIFYKLI